MASRFETELKERLRRESKILRDGVSDEALELLKERFEFGLPVFQFREHGKELDSKTLCLRAAIRDGNHEVIQFIELARSRKESD